jgi:arylformamidase
LQAKHRDPRSVNRRTTFRILLHRCFFKGISLLLVPFFYIFSGMKLIDLSHPISENTPVYPGSPHPKIEIVAEIHLDGYAEKQISFFSHTGTHLDAPSHILSTGVSLDRFSVEDFGGPASILDFSSHASQIIEIDDLEQYRYLFIKSDFILIHTGWSRYWGDDAYYTGYPVLSLMAAEWICRFNLKGIGIDALSVDPLASQDLSLHRCLLKNRILIIENLCRLHLLPQSDFVFMAMPLNIVDGDGSPVRAIAIL